MQFVPAVEARGTQTELSFCPMKFRYFMVSQPEMEEIHKMHMVNVRLENVISAEGAAKFITKGKLSEVLNSFTDDGTLRDKFAQENVYNYKQLREDLKTMLTNYTLEVTRGKELVREIQKLEAERNLQTQKVYALNDVAVFLDQQVSKLREALLTHEQAHRKCKITSKQKAITRAKADKGNIDASEELNVYHEYIEFLVDLNNRLDPLTVAHPAKLKYYYKVLHNFFFSRIDFVRKRARYEEDEYEDHPFIITFFYHIIKVIGAGGSYTSQKMFEFLLSMVKCQLNTKVLLMCRALGLIEGSPFGIDLQRRYLRYLQLMYEIKEGLDVPPNYDTCKL